ncbi:hypothetical protein NJ959_17080 [Symplocastrum sp. BBK-W-15]|uniref:Uncharacterized protein n=1 Tax=Limnofasciculus baicalensis BBK-W-15 TaxID=2699891 RepID=A0AAE3GUK2_9CYAN|nr:hypothetical protein [Limnofasciculus baicalensis BBK-W-15]
MNNQTIFIDSNLWLYRFLEAQIKNHSNLLPASFSDFATTSKKLKWLQTLAE